MLNRIDLSRVDLNLLTLFDVVMEERHVGRAAARLNLSASAVSHGLGRLRALLKDPLFLRNPRGVAPTARAMELSAAVADIIARARNVLASAEPFDPKTSRRRFSISASDGIAAVILPGLLAETARSAPGVDFTVRNLLPPFEAAYDELDARKTDVALIPVGEPPARFASTTLYEEGFVVAMRKGHKLGRNPDLKRYAAADHVLVSYTGDPSGPIDRFLAEKGLSRRVVLTVPNFLMALAVVAETGLVTAAPEQMVRLYAERLGLVWTSIPINTRSPVRAVAPQVAMMDGGVAWLIGALQKVSPKTAGKARSSK